MKLDQFDLVEINEAFAAQVIACLRDLPVDPNRVNVNGGAIAVLNDPTGQPTSAYPFRPPRSGPSVTKVINTEGWHVGTYERCGVSGLNRSHGTVTVFAMREEINIALRHANSRLMVAGLNSGVVFLRFCRDHQIL